MKVAAVEERTITLTNAKTHLSELVKLAAAGETVNITKRGKPVARISRPERAREPIDLNALRRLTASMPTQPEEAAELMRHVREGARY